MEKNKPSCPLQKIKLLVIAGKLRMTAIARSNAAMLGFDKSEVAAEILALNMNEFHKSMTTYNDHRIWQDVYRHQSRVGMLYVKLTVIDDVLVVSFKEL